MENNIWFWLKCIVGGLLVSLVMGCFFEGGAHIIASAIGGFIVGTLMAHFNV